MPHPDRMDERPDSIKNEKREAQIINELQELREKQMGEKFPEEFIKDLSEEEQDIIREEIDSGDADLEHALYNLEVAFEKWEEKYGTSDATEEDEAGESTDVGETDTESGSRSQEKSSESRERSRGMSREKVLADLLENPDKYYKEENGVYTMLFAPKTAAEKYIQIQHIINKNYENSDYFIQKVQDDEGKVYEWNADKTPPSFYDSDGKRLLIYSGDVVKVYKHGETAAEETTAQTEAPADAMQVVWKDETLSPAKVEELVKTLDENKANFKDLNDKKLKRDDLISKIDLALASDQLSTTSRQKLEAYRGQLDAYELQEDGKRSEKLSAAWEKEFANVAKIIDAAKAKNPDLEFNIESRGPRENNKILTLKANGREAKIKIQVWPLGKADYSPQGATKVWDTARENGKNVMADVLYKQRLPKDYESVDEITRTVTEWVSGVKVEGTFQPRAEAPAAAPTAAPVAGESREERAARITRESEAATAAEIDSYVPRREVYVDADQGTYEPSYAVETSADETARREVYADATTEDITDASSTDSAYRSAADDARARAEAYHDAETTDSGTTESGRTETISDAGAVEPAEEGVDMGEVPSTPMTFDEDEATPPVDGVHEADTFGIDATEETTEAVDFDAKGREFKEKLGLKGDVEVGKGLEKVYDNGQEVDSYRLFYRGVRAEVYSKDGNDYKTILYVKTSKELGEIPLQITQKGQIDDEINKMIDAGVLEKDAYYEEISVTVEQLKDKFKLKGTPSDILKEPNIINGTDGISFSYRGRRIISYTKSDGTTQVDVRPWGSSDAFGFNLESGETVDNIIDMDEPKEVYDKTTVTNFIDKYGAPAKSLVDNLGFNGLSKLNKLEYYSYVEGEKVVSNFRMDYEGIGRITGSSYGKNANPEAAIRDLVANLKKTGRLKEKREGEE